MNPMLVPRAVTPLSKRLHRKPAFRAQPQRIGEVYGVAADVAIDVESPGDADGIGLGECAGNGIDVAVDAEQ